MTAAGGVTAGHLISLLYTELKKIAVARLSSERAGHTLTATALVHEAYLRVASERHLWESRAQFFVAAGEAMRRVLIDHAKGKKAAKRGGGTASVSLEGLDLSTPVGRREVVALDQELRELQRVDPEGYEVVLLHFFAGLTLDQAGSVLRVTGRTAKRRWQRARLWLLARVRDEERSE